MQRMPYRIATDARRRLLSITFEEAFWDHDVADRFGRDCFAAATAMGCPPARPLVLVDLRNAVLQSQGVYEKMQALVGGSTADRMALVAALPLARMQTRRLQVRDNVVMFPDMASAQAWLFDGADSAAAA